MIIHNSRLLSYNIYFMIFLDSLGAGIVFPLMPELFFNSSLGFTLNTSIDKVNLYTIALLAFPLTQILGAPFLGILSDKHGQKKTILLGLGIITIGHLLGLIAVIYHSFFLFLFSRILLGFFSGISAMGNAVLSSSQKEHKFDLFSNSSTIEKLGLTFGPALAIFSFNNPLFANKLALPFFITFALVFLNLMLTIYNFKNFIEQRSASSVAKLSPRIFLHAAIQIFQFKRVRWLVIAFFLFMLSNGVFSQAFPLYATLNFNYTAVELGFFSFFVSFVILLSSMLFRKFLPHYSPNNQKSILFFHLIIILFFSLTSLNIHVFKITTLEEEIRFWIAACLYYFLSPTIRVLYTTLLSENTFQEKQGALMGGIVQINAITYLVAGLFSTFLAVNRFVILSITCMLIFSFLFLKIKTLKFT